MRTHFYSSDGDARVSIAKEELNERNETVMKEMRMDMTFEERLMAGRQPLVETDDEEEEAEEEKKSESEDAGSDDEFVKSADGEETIDDIIKEAETNIQVAESSQP